MPNAVCRSTTAGNPRLFVSGTDVAHLRLLRSQGHQRCAVRTGHSSRRAPSPSGGVNQARTSTVKNFSVPGDWTRSASRSRSPRSVTPQSGRPVQSMTVRTGSGCAAHRFSEVRVVGILGLTRHGFALRQVISGGRGYRVRSPISSGRCLRRWSGGRRKFHGMGRSVGVDQQWHQLFGGGQRAVLPDQLQGVCGRGPGVDQRE